MDISNVTYMLITNITYNSFQNIMTRTAVLGRTFLNFLTIILINIFLKSEGTLKQASVVTLKLL